MDEKLGSLFLKTKYNTLSNSPDVEKANPNTTNPVDRIDNWLKVIERTHINHISKDDTEKSGSERNGRLQTSGERVKENLKNHYFEKNIKVSLEVISAGYWNNKASIMINQGRGGDMESSGVIKNKLGNYIFPEEMKEQELGTIIKNQKDSLSSWFNYLTSDDAMYPMWAKYWVFQSVLKMGKLIKHEQDDGTLKVAFQNRTDTTTSPFPLLNQQALAKTISTVASLIEAKANLKGKEDKEDKLNISNESASLDNKQMLELAKTESFSKIYAQFLKEIPEYSVERLKNIAGQWKVYEKGSNPEELVNSLKGYPLEWCTANYDTAKSQLGLGDFYVYYSHNQLGVAKIPRVAIRTEDERIGEIRGIAPNQNLDPYIAPVIEAKMKEFGDEGKLYSKKAKDMEELTKILEKKNSEEELGHEDLKFIYEIDGPIQGFGYEKDPRIDEFRDGRDLKKDFSIIFNCREDQVSTTEEEVLNGGGIVACHESGYFDFSEESLENLEFPKVCIGNLYFSNLTYANGLKLPEILRGKLDLKELVSAENVVFPSTLIDGVNLSNLTSAKMVVLPETVNGDLNLPKLTSAEGITWPVKLSGKLSITRLTPDIINFLPKHLLSKLDMSKIISIEGVTLPENLDLNTKRRGKLVLLKNVIFPEFIHSDLVLNKVTSAEGVIWPRIMKGKLSLSSLISADGTVFPEIMEGNLYLQSLTSAKNTVWPKVFGDGARILVPSKMIDELPAEIRIRASAVENNSLIEDDEAHIIED